MGVLLTQIFRDKDIYKRMMNQYTEDMEVYRGMKAGVRADIREMSKEKNKRGDGPYWEFQEMLPLDKGGSDYDQVEMQKTNISTSVV